MHFPNLAEFPWEPGVPEEVARKEVDRVDLYSGLLGAGKTSLIRKMLSTAYKDQLVVIVENEIGRVNFDSAVLESGGICVEQDH